MLHLRPAVRLTAPLCYSGHRKTLPRFLSKYFISNQRCRANNVDPWVTTEAVERHHNALFLLALNRETVPPDPNILAVEQPALAALRYAVREVLLHVALPLLALWLLQRWLGHLEKRTGEAEGSSADVLRGDVTMMPVFGELANFLPIAAALPSRIALVMLTATLVARSIANIVQGLAERALLSVCSASTSDPHRLLAHGHARELLHLLKSALIYVDQFLIVFYQVAVVLYWCWAMLSLKDVAVNRFLLCSRDTTQGRQELERIIMPFNTFVTLAIHAAAGVRVLHLSGVDVRPLLLVTGWSSVVAGLASQQLLTNAISGVQMYIDRSFKVGDTISLLSGVVSYTGEVVEIAALRTHMALEDGSTVTIPNRSLADMIITNKSRSSRRLNRPPWYHSRAPLSMQLRIRLRPPDYGEALSSELEELRCQVIASGAVEVEGPLAPRVELLGYSDRGVELLVLCRLRNPGKLGSTTSDGASHSDTTLPSTRSTAQNDEGASEACADTLGAIARETSSKSSSSSAARDGAGPGEGAPPRFWPRSARDDAFRLLRQQLLLALGPWLHLRNATLLLD